MGLMLAVSILSVILFDGVLLYVVRNLPRNQMDHPWILLTAFIAGGAVVAGIGVHFYRWTRRFLNAAHIAQGVYTGSQWRKAQSAFDDNSLVTAYPTVTFTTAKGETVRYEAMVGVPWAGRYKGRHVEVLYNPDDTTQIRLNTFFEKHMVWIIPLSVGAGLSALGIMMLFIL